MQFWLNKMLISNIENLTMSLSASEKKEIKQDENGYYLPERKQVRVKKCTRCKTIKPESCYRSKKMCIECCEWMLEFKRRKKLEKLRKEQLQKIEMMECPAQALKDALIEANLLYPLDNKDSKDSK